MRFLLILLFPFISQATTYNIPIGTTVTSANNTINSAASGDSVFFQRGGTWNGNFYISGKNGVIISAYGSGAKPIITTRTRVPNSNIAGSWTNKGGNIWRMSLPSPLDVTHRIWLDGTEYMRSGDTVTINSTKRTFYDANVIYNLYVYATSNPATFYSTIEYPSDQSTTFYLSSCSNMKISNLDFRASLIALYIEVSSNCRIDNCNIGLDVSRIGMQFYGTCDKDTISNNTIDSGDRIIDDHLYQKGLADGVYMGAGQTNLRVYGNTVKDWGHSCIEFTNYDNVSFKDMSNNWVYENYLTAPDVDYCRGFDINGDSTRNNTGNKIFRNWINNFHVRSQINCPGEVTYNLITNITNSPDFITYYGAGGAHGIAVSGYSAGAPNNILIANNVIANTDEAGLYIQGDTTYGVPRNVRVINNIFYNNGMNSYNNYFDAAIMLQVTTGSSARIGNISFQNNLIYRATSGIIRDTRLSSAAFTLSGWQATSGTNSITTSNNINSDPLFVNPVSSFVLQSTSPAKGAGLTLTGYETGVGASSVWPNAVTTNTQPTAWNIGAYIGQRVLKTFSLNGKVLKGNGKILTIIY